AGPKYCFAPLALFALPRGAGARRLQAVAIQCGQSPRNHPVFTPADGDAWRKAKLVVTVADFNHHELVSHLGRTHLLIGPMVIATHRCLPDEHPVSTLLRPHFEGTLNINDMAQSTLVAPGHEVDKSLAGTIWESRKVAAEGLLAKPFNSLFLPADLEARGVTSASLEYPYREDALELWRAIDEWVSSYVKLYYRSDEQVRTDAALQEWAAEIVSQEGGRIPGFGDAGDGRIQTVAYLCQALTMIIFTASAQHAAVNSPQAELMTYAPATPPAAYRAAPLSESDSANSDYLDYLPPLELATLQMEFLHVLGGVFYTRLGHYQTHWFKDKQVGEPLARFQKKLDEIEKLITERNHTRFGPYPFLLPSRVPQSINV
ncbi:MAG TPA: lipoxygenase family protein, partial [Cystobacter sp.]